MIIDCAKPSLFNIKQSQLKKHSSPPTSQSLPTINTFADTGTTDFLVKSTDIPPHLVPSGPIITLCLPNKAQIKTLGSILIPIPNSDVIITAHVVHPDNLSHNLSSVSQLCVQGCSATFTSNSVEVTDRKGTIILSGAKNLQDLLWTLPIPISLLEPSLSYKQSGSSLANLAIHNTHDAEFVQFVHATFGSPSVSTFHRALRQGYLDSFPRITARMVRRNPPNTIATAMGHLDRVRQGMASTKASKELSPLAQLPFAHEQHLDKLDSSDVPDIIHSFEPDEESEHMFTQLVRVDRANH